MRLRESKSSRLPHRERYYYCLRRKGRELQSGKDFTGAGMIAGLMGSNYELTDTAKAAQFTYEKARQTGLTTFVAQAEHGRYLTSGMGSDIALCTALNKYPILPKMVDGVITV